MHRRAKRTLRLQHGQSDCGIACLASIIQYHGGHQPYERLKELSGATIEGVSLLGLFQASEKLGFKAEGLMAETVENLCDLSDPAILHVSIENSLSHFVVFYGFDADMAIVGDPAKGVLKYSKTELAETWKSKSLLALVPTNSFLKSKEISTGKRKWMFSLIGEDFPLLLIALFIGILISLLNLSTAFFSQTLVDKIIPASSKDKLLIGLALLVLVLLIRSLMSYLRGLFVIRQSKNFNERIIDQFYHRLLRLPKSFFDTRKIGELIARMNDTRRIQTVISFIAGAIVIDSLVLVVSITFLFFYSTIIGSVLTLSLPLFGLLIKVFSGKIMRAQNEVMHTYALSESHYVDAIQGIATIKANNKETFFDNLNRLFYSGFQNRIFQLGLLNNRFNLFAEVLSNLSVVLIFAIASIMVLEHSLRLGELIAILSIASGLMPSLNRLVIANTQVQEARIAFERMYDFASVAPEDNTAAQRFDIDGFNLEIENLSFRFPGGKLLLTDITFQVPEKGMVALLGESGSGKSTLIQILQKFYAPASGSIKFAGRPLADISTTFWRDLLGVVPQDVKIFNGSLLYNIALSDRSEEFVKALTFCEQSGFDVYFNKFPQGYLSILGEDGINISGGQKQLVALARALFKKPRLLILDEATSAMDRHTEKFIFNILRKLKCEISIVLVTHKVDSARLADKIYCLEQGTLREWKSDRLTEHEVL